MIHSTNKKFDFIIIGGGFFGVSLALFLSKTTKNILLIEKESSIMERGSKNNQARVHSGFHYPRSALTAVKSLILHSRFAKDFPDAIIDDFKMLYGISKKNSKISSQRFWRMFSDMQAPITNVTKNFTFFDLNYIDEVFECKEFAFDYLILKKKLTEKILSSGITVKLDAEVHKIQEGQNSTGVIYNDNGYAEGEYVFNISYGNINNILKNSNKSKLDIKNELVEIAMIEPPSELKNFGITIMDGPFFSLMPFPSRNCHSFTHVRHSLHKTWLPFDHDFFPYDRIDELHKSSKFQFMKKDAIKFMPLANDLVYLDSIFEIKAVLLKNEINDGRPILYHQEKPDSKVISVLGGKIDNIYDLLDIVKLYFPKLKEVNTNFLAGP